jgi:hypothetical protein
MSKNRCIVMGTNGPECPRCGNGPSEVREHKDINSKVLKQPFYYSRWFRCLDPLCPTTIFMREEFKVWNPNDRARQLLANQHERRTF